MPQPMSLAELEAYLEGITTVICCHPSQEERVRDALVNTPLPGAWRVVADSNVEVDKMIVMPPPRGWIP